jgi:Transcriptional regulator, AbiEi antitoxin
VCRIPFVKRKVNDTHGGRLAVLPATFTYAQARRRGVPDRTLYRWRDTGLIESIGRGLYRRTDVGARVDVDLLEIARRARRATLCLTTALARHGLTDEIPATIDVAVPRGDHRPTIVAPATWHVFDPPTFDLGRAEVTLDESTSIGLYGPERSIVDAIRLRHREGNELGYVALRRWLARPGSSPAELLAIGRAFPQAEKALREALEILL